MTDFEDQLEVFFGEASPAQARVYARLAHGDWPAEAKLLGTLRGPASAYAQTLPATYTFHSRRTDPVFLAQATVPDPCFWTPQIPFTYEANLQLRVGERVLAETSRTLGIRPLGVREGSFVFAGKRWVLRGAKAAATKQSLSSWHDAEAAVWPSQLTEELCEQAGSIGVLLLASPTDSSVSVRRLAQQAAVAMLVMDKRQIESAVNELPPHYNCVIVQDLLQTPHAVPHPRAQAVLVDAAVLQKKSFDESLTTVPIIAYRDAGMLVPQDVRSACDQLQADLATVGDFAGYLV